MNKLFSKINSCIISFINKYPNINVNNDILNIYLNKLKKTILKNLNTPCKSIPPHYIKYKKSICIEGGMSNEMLLECLDNYNNQILFNKKCNEELKKKK